MRLARPFYESLPFIYGLIGAAAIGVSYFAPGLGGKVAFFIGFCGLTAALTLALRRQDYRHMSREYTRGRIEP